jgi:ParB family transcriptional regulator, chromosome partitioning protein
MQTSHVEAATPNMTMLSLSLIAPGHNPRTYFDPEKMAEIEASIREKGVLQPILVRPIEGGFEIVAGERRYRAAVKVYGEEGNIPAVVQDMSDQEAEEAALIENTIRDDMSVTEEAVAAGRLLEKHGGNRGEAAAVLGWPLSKLTRRLALLNLTDEVMTALNERRIMVGHAELLAAFAKDKQNKALDNIIAKNLSVNQVRDLMVKATTEFSKAIFDKTACASCHHNSSQQATLFSVALEEGRCTNQDCFKKLTAEKIAAIRVEVEEEFPNVRLVEVGDPANYVTITADGDLGVGEEQLAACKGCGNYGATVSMIPGEEGKVERSICFDAPCHMRKVSERIKAEKVESGEEKGKGASTKKPGSGITKAKAEKKAAVSSLSEKVKEYRRKKVWNLAAENELLGQPGKASSFLLDLLLTGSGSKVNSTKLAESFNGLIGGKTYGIGDSNGHPDSVQALIPDHKKQLFTEAAASAVASIEEGRVKSLLTFLGADLGKHWKIDADFLNLLTKSEIEAVCTDIGLVASKPDFKKVIGGKKDEAIKAIMASGFDFTGKVPTLLSYDHSQQA